MSEYGLQRWVEVLKRRYKLTNGAMSGVCEMSAGVGVLAQDEALDLYIFLLTSLCSTSSPLAKSPVNADCRPSRTSSVPYEVKQLSITPKAKSSLADVVLPSLTTSKKEYPTFPGSLLIRLIHVLCADLVA